MTHMMKRNLRMDVVSRERMDIASLFRLSLDPTSHRLRLDEKGKGRGIYLARSKQAIEAFFAKKAFRRFGEAEDGLKTQLEALL